MKVRLAFAVAAHIEPEVLIIDEVLAVGDQDFQRKCLGKMEGVAKEGRTVLFVSHNMMMVSRLCHNVMWLEDGKHKLSGPTQEIIGKYLADGTTGEAQWANSDIPTDDREVFIESMRLYKNNGELSSAFKFGEPLNIEIIYNVNQSTPNLSICYQLYNSNGIQVFESRDTDEQDNEYIIRDKGKYKSTCHISDNQLMPDRYTLYVSAFVEKVKLIHHCESVLTFEIATIEEKGYSLKPWRRGLISPLFSWKIKRINEALQEETS